jgi:lantibiotic modifying enzyme
MILFTKYSNENLFKVTGNNSYLELAKSAGDVVWERGLLRKGYGLCHGTAGNGYVFLDLYRATNDTKWLHRAIKVSVFN